MHRYTRTIEVGENPALNLYDPFMDPDDLSFLPPDLQSATRVAPSGAASWPVSQAAAVIEALAGTGRLVLGLDIRDYQADGRFIEVAWSSYDGSDVREARDLALEALSRGNLPGGWVLITW